MTPQSPTAPTSLTVLVIDDTPMILDVIRAALEEEGYRVVTCLQSRDAVRLAERDKPDLVMLDIVMPEVSGWDILTALRARPELARLPVVICTAWVAEALGRLAELRGPHGDAHLGLLPKPFDVDELLEVVASVASTVSRAV